MMDNDISWTGKVSSQKWRMNKRQQVMSNIKSDSKLTQVYSNLSLMSLLLQIARGFILMLTASYATLPHCKSFSVLLWNDLTQWKLQMSYCAEEKKWRGVIKIKTEREGEAKPAATTGWKPLWFPNKRFSLTFPQLSLYSPLSWSLSVFLMRWPNCIMLVVMANYQLQVSR